jgi:intracellular sulfur oxidation DsrE/DsrF family protein
MLKFLATAVVVTTLATGAWAEGVTHRVAVHVDENDPQVMNMALNNVANLTSYYEGQGDKVIVEVVTYGPGLNMLIDGKSPVADRVATMSLEMENLTFAACANTMAGMKKKSGKDVILLDEAEMVPSGVVHLISLQEDGYAYIRP